jgi:hypothetical protein
MIEPSDIHSVYRFFQLPNWEKCALKLRDSHYHTVPLCFDK